MVMYLFIWRGLSPDDFNGIGSGQHQRLYGIGNHKVRENRPAAGERTRPDIALRAFGKVGEGQQDRCVVTGRYGEDGLIESGSIGK